MKFLIFAILLLYVFDCPNPFDEKTIEKIIKERKKEKRNFKHRNLKSGRIVYKNPESSITIYNDYILETLSLSVKAEGGTIDNIYLSPAIARNIQILFCDLKMRDENGQEISTYQNMTNYTSNIYRVTIKTYLPENYELSIKVSLKGNNTLPSGSNAGILYQLLFIDIPSEYTNNTHCKYIFNVDINSAAIKLEYELLKEYNDTAFIYDGLCPSRYAYEILRISPRQITWNHLSKVTAELKGKTPDVLCMATQVAFLEGSNFNITQNLLYTPLSTGKRNNDTFSQNYKFYFLYYYNVDTSKKYYLIKNLTFSSSPNYWKITDDIIKYYLNDTSTEKTKSFVKTILSNDTSNKPDYYKIGKWVYKNINYNRNHKTDSNPDDILKKREGVCHHFTLLYNAFLSSIGIKALHASGFVIKDIKTLGGENHAWTVALINGKWIALDATWDIFSGKVPQCHLYRKFDGSFDTFGYALPSDNKNIINATEELKLVEIVNITSESDSHSDSNYIKYLGINLMFLLFFLLS